MSEIIEIRDCYGDLLLRHEVAAGGQGLRGANLQGATYDGSTRFPSGFSPETLTLTEVDPPLLTKTDPRTSRGIVF